MKVHDTTEFYGTIIERFRCGPHQLVRYDTGEIRFRCIISLSDELAVIAALSILGHTWDWPSGKPPTLSPSMSLPKFREDKKSIQIHGFVEGGEWKPCPDDKSVNLFDYI